MNNKIRLSVPTMKCEGCVGAIETALNDANIAQATVNLESKTVSVTADTPVATSIATLKAAGFEATEIA